MRRLTAAEAEAGMRRVAGSLARVEEGARVVFSAPSSPELLVALVGTMRAGMVAVPLNPTLLAHERAELVADADPALVVDDAASLAALLDGPEADLAPVPRSRPMHYTSGTTGRPKGVWSGLLDDASAAALAAEEVDLWGFVAGDCKLVVSPLYHSAPLRFAAATLLQGGDVVVAPRFDAGLKRRAIDAFGPDVLWEFYGSTEGQFTACSSPEWLERPGTVGRARPGRRLDIDTHGTIWCEAPPHARFEYWRDPARTAEAWRGSAFTVGDLGRLDGDGYLWLDGRRDDLVISGGVNVYPLEVEQALADLPGLDEVAVFGVDDDRWGQRVCAAVVGSVTPAAVLAHARQRLAPYKVPKEVHVVAELPRTGTGKVRRRDLAAELGLDRTDDAG